MTSVLFRENGVQVVYRRRDRYSD